jgi:8-oxo-dGTP diphosphatase
MKQYVLAFAFNLDCTRVLLIHKNRPSWQAGRYNAPGGRIEREHLEAPIDAVVREFKEECGLWTPDTIWRLFLIHQSRGDEIFSFCMASTHLHHARTITDEPIAIVPVRKLPDETLPQLHWMIPLAINKLGRDPGLDFINAAEHLKP